MFARLVPKIFVSAAFLAISGGALLAAEWSRFRGPRGNGVSDEAVPTSWSAEANLSWKTKLPGPGASS
ncbi:MAG: serine/threonine protein kinase, partial [Planctomycetota bacterium]